MATLDQRRSQMFKSEVSSHKNWYIDNFVPKARSVPGSGGAGGAGMGLTLPAIGGSGSGRAGFSKTM